MEGRMECRMGGLYGGLAWRGRHLPGCPHQVHLRSGRRGSRPRAQPCGLRPAGRKKPTSRRTSSYRSPTRHPKRSTTGSPSEEKTRTRACASASPAWEERGLARPSSWVSWRRSSRLRAGRRCARCGLRRWRCREVASPSPVLVDDLRAYDLDERVLIDRCGTELEPGVGRVCGDHQAWAEGFESESAVGENEGDELVVGHHESFVEP